MKAQRITTIGNSTALPVHPLTSWLPGALGPVSVSWAAGIVSVLLFVVAGPSTQAQTVRFRSNPVRVTVPLSSINTTVITNAVNVGGLDTNAPTPVDLSVSGLPAGAGYTLTATNGDPLVSTVIDTNVLLTVFTTNIVEGVYTFSLNATGGATNSIPFILQSAHIWNGSLDASNNWANPASWLGGVPTTTSDVVIGDIGAQTNVSSGTFGITNIGIDANMTIASLRFSQTGRTNAAATNEDARPFYHTIQLNNNSTLTITGTNGLSLLRDEVEAGGSTPPAEFPSLGTMAVNIAGGGGLVVSNASANFAILVPNIDRPTLNLSNLNTFVAFVSRVGLADYQLYPNYDNYNGLNDFNSYPRQFIANVYLARTNVITALYRDPDNYTNEFTRTYGVCYEDSERFGVGSSTSSFLYLGQTNRILADGVCLVHSATGGGTVQFAPTVSNGVAFFRNTNGTGRLSVFTVSDGAAGTNVLTSNLKATIDFSTANGLVDIQADRFYIARDRTLIASNDNPTFEGTVTFGRGTVDVNTAILGFQEHNGRTNWTAIDPAAQAYRGYCKGDLTVNNGGLFKVNGNLTLGYVADTNDEAVAQQYNTRGTILILSNSTVIASNIIADGGINFVSVSPVNPRQNAITINQGNLIVTNGTIGAAPGLPLQTLSMNSGTLTIAVVAGRTNAFVNNFVNPGSLPSTIKIVSLSGVNVFPTNIPIISYVTATPFVAADTSVLGLGTNGYIINNTANNTIDLFLTTNAPKVLVWRGNVNNHWDLSTANWGPIGGGPDTVFSMGDVVTFNDSSSVTNIDITEVVVPNQAAGTNGVTITNTVRGYIFNNAGGAIAGTAKIVKSGTNSLTFNAAESGPVTVLAGNVDGSGTLGSTTIASNVFLNFSGTINGGLTSTGAVVVPIFAVINGGVTIRGGSLENSGTINGNVLVSGGANVTNTSIGIFFTTGTSLVSAGSTLANFGFWYNQTGRLNVGNTGAPFDGGLLYGTGTLIDPDGGTVQNTIDGRLAINPSAVVSPGPTPINSIGTLFTQARLDLNNVPAGGVGVLRIEVDFNDPQTNDMLTADRWSNLEGMLLITNINPAAGAFTNVGQTFQILVNNGGPTALNLQDAAEGTYPLMSPVLPSPGLQWGLSEFRSFGRVSITNTALIWDGLAGGNWDTNGGSGNWKNGKIYGDNQGAMFDDSANGTTSIVLNSPVAPLGYAVTSFVVGSVTNLITNCPAMSPGIVISNSALSYTFIQGGPTNTARFTGITGLYKTGPGTLTLLQTNNDFTGNTIIDGGTVVFTNGTALGQSGNLNGAKGVQAEVYVDGGTLRFIGTFNNGLSRATVINPNGVTIDVISPTNELSAANLLGPGALTKVGPGTLRLNSGGTYSGGTIVNQGLLLVTGNDRTGTNSITLNSAAFNLSGATFTLPNAMNINGASTILNTNVYVYGGPWSGNGSLTLSNTSVLVWNTNIANFGGIIAMGTNSGNLRFNAATNNNKCLGSAAATFDLGTGTGSLSNFNGGAVTYDIGALIGGPNTLLAGRITNAPTWTPGTTYSIGANGSNTVFAGRIVNGQDTVSVTKVGSGMLALNGNNTYTGLTTVSAGTLGGTGVISGPVTVTVNGTLAPGMSIGTMAINNSLTLGGTMSVEVSGGTPNSDKVVGLTSVTYGGALVVSNVGPGAVAGGDTFQLFNIGGSGNFTSITPALTGGLSWSFNPATGVLSVTGGRPKLNIVNNGDGTLTFSWVNNGTDTFRLQAQTNSISVGITPNWFDYPGGGSSPVTTAINPSNPTVFYRLISN